LRLSERRLNKLRNYAVSADKTMTQIIEDYIDSLPNKEIGDNSDTLFPLKPTAWNGQGCTSLSPQHSSAHWLLR